MKHHGHGGNNHQKTTDSGDHGHHKEAGNTNQEVQKSANHDNDGYQMQRHHKDEHQNLTSPKHQDHQKVKPKYAETDIELTHSSHKRKHGSKNNQPDAYDDDSYVYNYHNAQEPTSSKDASHVRKKNKEQQIDRSAHASSFHAWHDYSSELEEVQRDRLLKLLTSQDHSESQRGKKGWIHEKEGENNRDDVFDSPLFGNILSSKLQAFGEDRSGQKWFNPYTWSESIAKPSRYHSGHHGRDRMTDWLSSKNVTTMLTGRQWDNRRLVLAKKTIEYFLLPQQLHHLIQTGQLTDIQSNLTTSREERKISQGGLNRESPQHHHHHHYHHPNHREPQSIFYNAFPFLQPLMPGSVRQRPHIPSDYSLQFQPNAFQIAAGDF